MSQSREEGPHEAKTSRLRLPEQRRRLAEEVENRRGVEIGEFDLGRSK